MIKSRITQRVDSVTGRPYFPHQLAFLIDNPLRRLLISPEQVAERLSLADDSHVLEIGPGSGFFSVELARRVLRGRLELFDLQPEMLAKARRKLEAAGMSNVGFTMGDARELPFPMQSFDRVLLVAVLGEVLEPKRCLRAIHDVLVPGGLLAVHEHMPDPDWISPNRLDQLLSVGSFKPVMQYGPAWNYTKVYRKSCESHGCPTEPNVAI